MRGIVYALIFSLILWVIIIFAAVKAFGADQCRYQHLDRRTWTQREEERTARCVLKRFGPIPGGFRKLDQVTTCESDWNRLALSSSYTYLGLLQQSRDYWRGRFERYEPANWTLRPRWQNSRTMLVISVRMVAASGWNAWSCA